MNKDIFLKFLKAQKEGLVKDCRLYKSMKTRELVIIQAIFLPLAMPSWTILAEIINKGGEHLQDENKPGINIFQI